jgi:peptidoglycan hydrolase CwlO-like protein
MAPKKTERRIVANSPQQIARWDAKSRKDGKIDSLESEVEELKNQVKQLQEKLGSLTERVSELENVVYP